MAPKVRSRAVASRRRRQDDGEEEGSVADLEEDSLSDGSVISHGDDDADAEQSDVSEEDEHGPEQAKKTATLGLRNRASAPTLSTSKQGSIGTSSDVPVPNGVTEEAEKDTSNSEPAEPIVESTEPVEEEAVPPKPARETPAERVRREHVEYLKEKRENPAFVPNRGGFFLHDNRAGPSGVGFRQMQRGRGRGMVNGFQPRGAIATGPADQPWRHDLHDSVSHVPSLKPQLPQQRLSRLSPPKTSQAPSSSDVPRQSFSTTVVLGKIPVNICLFGMAEKIVVPDVAKKRHTLLPRHRPPLRSDKPVRISLPMQQPRYVHPAPERSFTFIPRAQRPNQQPGRGRGRFSFAHTRRTSTHGGSSYTPSLALSRRSSLGGVFSEAVRSPVSAILPFSPSYIPDAGKPVVRLPPAARNMPGMMPMGPYPMHNVVPMAPTGVPLHTSAERQEYVSTPVTMHQPRPQKAVSVADIESPARLGFDSPANHQEQPFHQQMPPPSNGLAYGEASTYATHSRRPSQASRPSGTPLSQIPERAIYAQPFQPYPYQQPGPGYVLNPYATNAMFYPAPENTALYNGSLPNPGMPLPFQGTQPPSFGMSANASGAPSMPIPPTGAPAPAPAPNMVAHESNGMVYYYDSSQLPPNPEMPYSAPFSTPGVAGAVPLGGMVTPPAQFYYPPSNQGAYFVPQ